MPIDKKPVLAYDREKRVYKDAYVTNFRQVRHFPALATIGAGKADGDSIILVQEGAHATPREGDAVETDAPSLRSRFKDVPSRLIPHDSVGGISSYMYILTLTVRASFLRCWVVVQLDAMFESTAPLSNFRNAVMCKHTNARLVNGSTPMSGCKNQSSCDSPGSRYGLSTVRNVCNGSPIFRSDLVPNALADSLRPYSKSPALPMRKPPWKRHAHTTPKCSSTRPRHSDQ